MSSQIESSSLQSQSSSLDSGDFSSSEDMTSSIIEESSIEPIAIYYHVVFKNDDESILEEQDVLEGEDAIYHGEEPSKEADDEFTYEFIGWDQDLTNIHADVTTKAEYKATQKENWGEIIYP